MIIIAVVLHFMFFPANGWSAPITGVRSVSSNQIMTFFLFISSIIYCIHSSFHVLQRGKEKDKDSQLCSSGYGVITVQSSEVQNMNDVSVSQRWPSFISLWYDRKTIKGCLVKSNTFKAFFKDIHCHLEKHSLSPKPEVCQIA